MVWLGKDSFSDFNVVVSKLAKFPSPDCPVAVGNAVVDHHNFSAIAQIDRPLNARKIGTPTGRSRANLMPAAFINCHIRYGSDFASRDHQPIHDRLPRAAARFTASITLRPLLSGNQILKSKWT
jgi:hypothetical protein